jgi:hypothetical protein
VALLRGSVVGSIHLLHYDLICRLTFHLFETPQVRSAIFTVVTGGVRNG